MCYYTAYLYTVCGHVSISEFPVHNSPCWKRVLIHGRNPQRRPKSLPPPDETKKLAESESTGRPLSTTIPGVAGPVLLEPSETKAAQSDCEEKLVHAMHTLNIEDLCAVCRADREVRLRLFQVRMRDDMGRRMSSRLMRLNNGLGWRGRQFRATSVSPPGPIATTDGSGGSSGAGDDEAPPSLTALGASTRRANGAESDVTDVSVTAGRTVSVQDAVGNFMRGVKGGWTFSSSSSSSSTGRPSIFAPQVSPRSRTPVMVIAEQSSDSQISLPPPLVDTQVMLSFGGLGD